MASEDTQVTRTEEEPLVPEEHMEEPVFSPQVDIIEKKDSVVILADMPGVSKENVDVMLEEGVLTIEGRVEGDWPEDLELQREEYQVGSFHRRFAVGEGLDVDNVEATMEEGVLRLCIAKSERYQPRRIQIQ